MHSKQRYQASSRRFALGGLFALAACQTVQQNVDQVVETPTAALIRGQAPSGSVRLDENFLAAAGEGSGTLTFQGRAYPFKLVGSIMGPGGAVRIDGQGNVYKLARVDDFFGRYTQHSGSAGLAQDGTGELWLQNDSGVVMHLTSQVRGMILSLGRQEIVILRP